MFENYDINDREQITLHCLITLESPLSHIGEVVGNVSNLKTLKVVDLEGNPRQCFVYSGNAIRNGILRRRGVASALTELGLTVNPNIHHTMFAGGRIDGSTASNMELDTKIRQLLPWLSVLGTAKPTGVFATKESQMIQGRLNVGRGYLISYESAEYVFSQFPGAIPPDAIAKLRELIEAKNALIVDPFSTPSEEAIARYEEIKSMNVPYLRKSLRSWTEYISIDQTTRRDSTLDPTLQRFLPSESQNLLKGETEEKKKKSDQMIASDRLIMQGSKLYSRWDLHTTKVEAGWIIQALLEFAKSPYIGGKGNRGNGLISIDFWYQSGGEKGDFISLKSSINQQSLSGFAQDRYQKYREYIQRYQQYLAEKKSDIAGFLD